MRARAIRGWWRGLGLAPILLGLSLSGCPAKPAVRAGPPPKTEELLAHLDHRAARLPRLRTEAKVDYLGGGGERVKLSMTFLLDRAAGRLRIDAESPIGGTVLSLATDGKRFQLLDVRENRFLEGEASPCNLGRLLRVRLSPAELIDVIAGGAPLVGRQAPELGWDGAQGGREQLTVHANDPRATERLWLAPSTWDVAGAEVTGADGKTLYTLTHEDFAPVPELDGLRFPARTTIADPARGSDAKIRVRSREAVRELPPNAFHLDPPPGIPVETARCE